MSMTVKDMVAQANAAVPRLPPAEVAGHCAQGAVLVDVRDPHEVANTGRIAGALAISRGMLEFRACCSSPMWNPALRTDTVVLLYCASGGRSALAGRTLQAMGFGQVYNAGGFKELADSGLPVEPA